MINPNKAIREAGTLFRSMACRLVRSFRTIKIRHTEREFSRIAINKERAKIETGIFVMSELVFCLALLTLVAGVLSRLSELL